MHDFSCMSKMRCVISTSAARIRELAEHLGWSLRRLALAASINPTRLQDNVRNDRRVDSLVLISIAAATGCHLRWLATGVGPMMDPEFERLTQRSVISADQHTTESGGGEVTRLPPGLASLYNELPKLVPRAMADDLQRVIRIHLGRDLADVERISFFLQGADPGEKKAGLDSREDARLARGGRGTFQLTED